MENIAIIFSKFNGTIQNLTISQQLSIATLTVASVFALWKIVNSFHSEKTDIKYPPGPSGIPFFGSIHLANIVGKLKMRSTFKTHQMLPY